MFFLYFKHLSITLDQIYQHPISKQSFGMDLSILTQFQILLKIFPKGILFSYVFIFSFFLHFIVSILNLFLFCLRNDFLDLLDLLLVFNYFFLYPFFEFLKGNYFFHFFNCFYFPILLRQIQILVYPHPRFK